jgi:hypothetical protein
MEDNEIIQKLAKAMDRWYWSRKDSLTKDDAIRPAIDVLEYIYKAKKSGLDKRSETAYCGSVLLYSVLLLTIRRFTSDVNEANELYEVGKNLASLMWDKLDGAKDGNHTINSILEALWSQYNRLKEES